tara:strand:- start:910 stop:1071 length:162 start_codon:yes stop_codon:yes gene_type:complete
MNTEKLVIFKDESGTYYDKAWNYKGKTLQFYRNLAVLKGFGGGVEIFETRRTK